MSDGALFTPYAWAGLDLPNRIVMAPMTRSRAGPGNTPHDLNAEYYRQRATAALIITEASQVSRQGVGYPATPGIHSDEQVDGWRQVTDAVHEADGHIILQLWHVGRISHPSLQPDGGLPVAPSAIAPQGEAMTLDGMTPFLTPRALDTDEVLDIVEQFRHGALMALDAGFDGVEVHGANGYLLDQFTRDSANRRKDAYGGTIENRLRLPLAVTEAVVEAWGGDRVGYRISPFQAYNDMADSDPVATFIQLANALHEIGIGYLHVVEMGDPGAAPAEADTDDFIAARHPLFTQLRQAFPRTLMANGGYCRARGEAVVAEELADLVSYAARYLANPDLVRRFAEDAPENPPARATFYGGGAEGYTDYPFLD